MRVNSPTKAAILRGVPATGVGNFSIFDLTTLAGVKQLDVYAALLARVLAWQATISGRVTNSSSLFSTSTTLTGSVLLPVTPDAQPQPGEKRFVYGAEHYPIFLQRGGDQVFHASTALTMIGDGIIQQPGAPPLLSDAGGSSAGPQMTALRTQRPGGGRETGQCDFGLSFSQSTSGVSTGGPSIGYSVGFTLQTSPFGRTLDDSSLSVPVGIGRLDITVPDWRHGGSSTVSIPLYCDPGQGDSLTWLTAVGSGFDYVGHRPRGSVLITMIPAVCWPCANPDGTGRLWSDAGHLLIPKEEFLRSGR